MSRAARHCADIQRQFQEGGSGERSTVTSGASLGSRGRYIRERPCPRNMYLGVASGKVTWTPLLPPFLWNEKSQGLVTVQHQSGL